jgi:hypothetical protein
VPSTPGDRAAQDHQRRWQAPLEWHHRSSASDRILIRVLHPGLFPQDRTGDLRERRTGGDR